MKKTDFLVIGAQKCATSWLYFCLKNHPQIYVPSHKDQMDYIGGNLFREKGYKWFENRKYQGVEESKFKGDVSVEYLPDSRAPEIIAKYQPDVKVLVSLRNPIERAKSAYQWYQRKGVVKKDLSLDSSMLKGLNGFHDNIENWYTDIIIRGLYFEQLKHYLDHLPNNKFFFIIFDHIKSEPLDVIKKTYSFLGVRKKFIPSSLKKKPKKNSYLPVLSGIERKFRSNRVITAAVERLNQYMSWVGFEGKTPKLKAGTKEKLVDFYKSDVQKLNDLLSGFSENQTTSREDLLTLWNFKK